MSDNEFPDPSNRVAASLSASAVHLRHLLRTGRTLTLTDIEEQVGVSRRHARRLLRRLQEEGLPLQVKKRGREKEYRVPAGEQSTSVEVDLTERQALALMLSASVVRSGPKPIPLETSLDEALDRVTAALSGQVLTFEPELLHRQIHVRETGAVNVDADLFLDLLRAIANRRRLKMDYYTASTDTYRKGRRFEPWALARLGDTWLCVAVDPAKSAKRDFSLARMENVRPADPESPGGDYQIPDEFDLEIYFNGRFESLAGDEAHTVRLRVEPEKAPYFRSKTYHRTQQIENEEESGHLIVSYEVMGLEEITTFVQSWGCGIEVLDPMELRKRVAQEARAVAQIYDAR
jgi:predicted DNA-binding transcriptional regulator YafY